MASTLLDISAGGIPYVSNLETVISALKGNTDISDVTAFAQIASPASGPAASVLTTSGNLTGNYQYAVAFVTGFWSLDSSGQLGQLISSGNTGGGVLSATVSPNSEQVSLSNIPTGPSGTVARVLYRTMANGSSLYFLYQINDNTTTSWTDNTPDTSLGASMPTLNTTGTTYDLWNLTAKTANINQLTVTSTTQPILFPNLTSFPAVGPSGAMIVMDSGVYVSDGTAWVNPMAGLMMFSTGHGGTADFYGPTTLHGGVGLHLNALAPPAGLAAANATSGAVGTYLAANTTYTYALTYVTFDNPTTETSAGASASVTTGTTAYPINLTWSMLSSGDASYVNIYKNGNFLAQVAGTATSYQDTGNTATTSQVPPLTNLTGAILSNAPGHFHWLYSPNNPGQAAPYGQGVYVGWNLSGGTGETNFLNHPGAGGGGWSWNNWNGTSWVQQAFLDYEGNLTVGQNTVALGAIPGFVVRTASAPSTTNPEFHFESGRYSSTQANIVSYDGAVVSNIATINYSSNFVAFSSGLKVTTENSGSGTNTLQLYDSTSGATAYVRAGSGGGIQFVNSSYTSTPWFVDNSGNENADGYSAASAFNPTTPLNSFAGTTAGTVYWAETMQGTTKLLYVQYSGYENDTTTSQTFTLSTGFSAGVSWTTNSQTGTPIIPRIDGATVTIPTPASTTAYTGSIVGIGN